jgi:hypothetical protein
MNTAGPWSLSASKRPLPSPQLHKNRKPRFEAPEWKGQLGDTVLGQFIPNLEALECLRPQRVSDS